MNTESTPDVSARRTAPPRLALTVPVEAAEALGCGVDYFNNYIRHELRVVKRGRRTMVAVTEIERWLKANSALTLEAHADTGYANP